jgi:hypothetical protein
MPHRVFNSEDDAAEFIADIKRGDPEDDFTYVIVPDSLSSGKYFIEIVTPGGRSVGRVLTDYRPE